jgi:hypothetical protein
VPAEDASTVACPNCGKDIVPSDPNLVLPINPPPEVQDALLDQLLAARAAAKTGKKRKADKGEKGEKVDKAAEEGKPSKAARVEGKAKLAAANGRTNGASPAPNGSGRSTPTEDGAPKHNQTVRQKLAEQEQKRLAAQANMSEAVRSMFRPRGDPKDQTTEFFGRTFNRVSRIRLWRVGEQRLMSSMRNGSGSRRILSLVCTSSSVTRAARAARHLSIAPPL